MEERVLGDFAERNHLNALDRSFGNDPREPGTDDLAFWRPRDVVLDERNRPVWIEFDPLPPDLDRGESLVAFDRAADRSSLDLVR